ncbi:MAG TPA: hypothetical protein VNA27_09550 [Rubrobacteraceae bacterium]|nr:hypothetical protein [Rubrobacteraceae bacterium]
MALDNYKTFNTAIPHVLFDAAARTKEDVSVNAGHVGMLVGPAAVSSLWPRLRDWLAPRSSQ